MNDIATEEQIKFPWLQSKTAFINYLNFPQGENLNNIYEDIFDYYGMYKKKRNNLLEIYQEVIFYELQLKKVQEKLLTNLHTKYRKYIHNNTYHDYRSEYPFHQNFSVMTFLNKSSFDVGDSLNMEILITTNQYTIIDTADQQSFEIDAKKYDENTYYTIATCEGNIPCTKEHSYKVNSGTRKLNKYIVHPK
ncbi:MAG: hypothetical protein GY828_07265 [Candidatus Gracilibacteria bacterium]|nr:hypothetical protein [Candidatus Gracilibacteria bacterium]